MEAAQLAMLLDGIDLKAKRPARWTPVVVPSPSFMSWSTAPTREV
jgi:hypothetical protein